MNRFKTQIDEITTEIRDSEDRISVLEDDLVKVREDKLFYKRKEDAPNFDKVLKKEIDMVKEIKFLENNIDLLEDRLIKIKAQQKKSIKTRSKMDKVIKVLETGKSRVEASKITGISIPRINKWYDDGKRKKDYDSIYFYEHVKLQEDFYENFSNILRKEFKKQNKITIFSDFVPHSEHQRLDRFYNEDSSLWFSGINLKNSKSIYYFGLKGDYIPKLILVFDKDYKKSNFRLIGNEVFVLLKFKTIENIKKEFRLLSVKSRDDLYYVSLGKLMGGTISNSLEFLLNEYLDDFTNAADLTKLLNKNQV